MYGTGRYTYALIKDWAKLPDQLSLTDVSCIAFDGRGRLYALTRNPSPVMIFDPDGTFVTSWGEGHFTRAHGICVGPDGAVYCTDDKNHTVSKFTADGKLLMTLGTRNKPSDTGYRDVPDVFERIGSIVRAAGPFNRPAGIAVAPSGEIYVTDGYGNARVHCFSPEGKLLRSWGEPGAGLGQFRLPHAVKIDRKNRVWVVDRENSRIQIFDARGGFLGQWTDLIRPTDLCIDSDDVVYVSELCARVSIFTIDGTLLARLTNENDPADKPMFIAPHTVAVDAKGDLYVGELALAAKKINRGNDAMHKLGRR
ncbi:MAG TPA: peptidyl-alpha-hydroxyglycine alpha-amidating lyase family protein [Spirochaetia bacterium]